MTRSVPRSRLAPMLALALLAAVIVPPRASAQAPAETAPPANAAAPATPVPAPPPDADAPQDAPAAQASVPLPPLPALASDEALPHDMSPLAMVRNADLIVKGVMAILAAASVATWTIFIAKRLQLAGARFRAVRGVREVLRATSLFDLDRARHKGSLKSGPVAALVHAAAHERERSSNLPADGIKERAAIALGRIEARAARSMTRGTGLVASIGSTAPFVGLFGTVWGIMNSFVGISQAHTTNLAVVAPGIAEALLATAVGLVAAIPAVIIYNGLARAIAGYKAVLSDASAEVMRHLSRDLDRQLSAAE